MTHKNKKKFEFKKAYRELRTQLVMMGMFKSNQWFYAYKCATNMSMWTTAMTVVYFSDNVFVHLASSLLLGLFSQQFGWLTHEFLHHQVFKYHNYGDLAGVFWGNLMQGYSMQW